MFHREKIIEIGDRDQDEDGDDEPARSLEVRLEQL